jgi:hypothetical protein
MSKGTVVRGTPVNHISATNGQGFNNATMPAKYAGTTTSSQYKGDQSQQPNPRSGTPAQSRSVNDDVQRLVSDHRYGVSPGAGGQDYNSPSSNGNGTVFDGISRASGYTPRPAAAMDSPVSPDSPMFDTRTIRQENQARSGNVSPALIEDDLRKIPGGTMDDH